MQQNSKQQKGGKQNQKQKQEQKQNQNQPNPQENKNKEKNKNKGQQKKENKNKMSKEDAKRLLDALKDDENKTQKKLKKLRGQGRYVEKDW